VPPLDVVVVPHTHWDREWYQPAGRFRQRLVALVDELLDRIAAGDAPPAFLLDGRRGARRLPRRAPRRREALAAALAAGRLEAGPWYVLADTLLPGAEPLVRNLLAGRRAVRALGAEPPPVLYCPDSFGHPAALPALAAGFGSRRWWRGAATAGAAGRPATPLWWRAADGARALLLHLPPDGLRVRLAAAARAAVGARAVGGHARGARARGAARASRS
jgi:alpha-mannosidase